MTRLIDRGAVTAAYVGIGVALTVGVSFLLVIPIEPIVWLLALPSGLLIGYYANQRSNRRAGQWSRIVRNGLFAAIVTGLSMALLLLMVKSIFFFADSGFPDFNRVDANGASIPPSCQPGADCVYARYLALGRGAELEGIGVTDAATFTSFYWMSQATSASAIIVLTTVGGLGGALLYGASRPRDPAAAGTRDGSAPTIA